MRARPGTLGFCCLAVFLALASTPAVGASPGASPSASYADLLTLFADWRAFERPPLRDGAPDYSAATVARRHAELAGYRARLEALDVSTWPVEQRVDLELVRAEMNGFDFDARVLQPWARDPAFYATLWTGQSDTPSHEGPVPAGICELWTYTFPLSAADEAKLAAELRPIPAFLAQARTNLTGNARDLWTTGIGTVQQQVADLADLERRVAANGPELRAAVAAARRATEEFVRWLEAEAPSKTGPSGIGKENYTWNLRHVHLVPMSWEEEVALLQRELARAHAALKLEEERNRALPPLVAAADDAEYQRRADLAVTKLLAFVRDRDLYSMRDYLEPALRAHLGSFEPLATRNFFAIAMHFDPITLYTHATHWWDNARMREEPHSSPVRRGALRYNIWDSRSEGMATAMEELLLHAGLYDDTPRLREIVWVMLAQRAARGLASLYLQDNQMDIAQAKAFQVEWTPRGWMRPDLDLLGFEQQLYLRQPGYGTSYVTGKHLIDDLIRVRAHQLGDAFTLKTFFTEVNAAGMIPVSLIRWQMTGEGGPPPAADVLRSGPIPPGGR
uniref:DUF885 domain-containing protein n=1 Tax=uncultured bacterium A1Q1_fos_517 TaxID=1256582 RepID=L7VWW7_9BACT|nr:hypothetical protein [uncultured bacterium A1Q1_fos_517]